MESQEFTKSICRICLDENASVDWNTTLYQYYNMTYKDCYYRYTQLKYFDEDHFSQMLCQNCSNGLHNTHALVSKALESHKFFQDEFGINIIQLDDEIKYTPTGFETELVEKIKGEPIVDDCFEYEECDEEFISIAPVASSSLEDKIEKCGNELPSNSKDFDGLTTSSIKLKKKNTPKVKAMKSAALDVNNIKTKIIEDQNTEEKTDSNSISNDLMDSNKWEEDFGVKSKPKVRKTINVKKIPRMCSICSKVLYNKYALKKHEETHNENRERKIACPVCGFKFYDKMHVYSHMKIHEKNRERKHKCEFCSKAFYNKGDMNLHRRIHLGQMVSCSLCSKQYVRQLDLDRHMSTHSDTIKNSDTKKRLRGCVWCEHCERSIHSSKFKSHTATHLKRPLMKCSICDKKFFRKGSCVLHVQKVHQKTDEEYNDFIILCN